MVVLKTLYDVPIDNMWKTVLSKARVTVNKDDTDTVPSLKFKKEILASEHSPMRLLWFDVTFFGIPTYVSQQYSRHLIAGVHEQFNGVEYIDKRDSEDFVSTQRTDRTGIDRTKLPQNTPVNHSLIVNAKGLIDMSRKRLCLLADKEAIKWWRMLVNEMKVLCPEVADRMHPDCVYRGNCYEMKCCGYNKTKKYQNIMIQYKMDE